MALPITVQDNNNNIWLYILHMYIIIEWFKDNSEAVRSKIVERNNDEVSNHDHPYM